MQALGEFNIGYTRLRGEKFSNTVVYFSRQFTQAVRLAKAFLEVQAGSNPPDPGTREAQPVAAPADVAVLKTPVDAQ